MEFKVLFSEDPAFVLSRAGGFLSSQPVFHNLVLSILHARAAQGDPGRYCKRYRIRHRLPVFTGLLYNRAIHKAVADGTPIEIRP
jgi:hypothetical protein